VGLSFSFGCGSISNCVASSRQTLGGRSRQGSRPSDASARHRGRIVHVDKRSHHKLRRIRAGFVAVGKGGFVPVMAVGDVKLLWRSAVGSPGCRRLVIA